MGDDTIHWGIIGTGRIAHDFARGLAIADGAALCAVQSRSLEKARAFATEFHLDHGLTDLQAMLDLEDLDVIYVATPHVLHAEQSIACLRAGKAVLCEKPVTVNANQAREIIQASRDHRTFFMEGMWTHFFPLMQKARDIIASGDLGEIRMVQSSFGFQIPVDPEGRLFNPALGGGALLDVGVYTVSLAQMLFGEQPESVHGEARIGPTGVDEDCTMLLRFPSAGMAVCAASIQTPMRNGATIYGTQGSIEIPQPFWRPKNLVVKRGKDAEEISCPFDGNGFQFEANHVMRCLREGLTESPLMTHDFSLGVMTTLDRLRASWDISYPGD